MNQLLKNPIVHASTQLQQFLLDPEPAFFLPPRTTESNQHENSQAIDEKMRLDEKVKNKFEQKKKDFLDFESRVSKKLLDATAHAKAHFAKEHLNSDQGDGEGSSEKQDHST